MAGGKRMRGQRGILVEALERASGVPECLGGASGGAVEAQGPVECEKAGNPRARQAGEGGVGGQFKGT